MTAREQTSASTTPPAARARPYLIGVRHHSPALAVAVPRLLDAVDAEVVCVELPADFQPWLPYLADPHTVAPVALSGAYEDGRLHFYPLADFSPELAAIRWARDRGAEVVCCDLPLAHPAWSCGPPDGTAADVDELWERTVEALAPGGAPEAVRRAALGFGRALREDTAAHGGIAAGDLAREAHMRRVLAEAGPRRVAAVVGAFHAPGLADPDERAESVDAKSVQAEAAGLPGPGSTVVTSLVPYAFALLDPRSGYPAGIRDPRWRQAVLDAGGDPGRVRDAAARFITELCREIRASGDTAGTGEAVETLRLACDLGTLRGLPAPGRGELLEAVTSVLGKGRSPDRELRLVLVGPGRGRLAPGTPRSGLGPWVEAELAALRLPGPADPDGRDVRLAPLRSDLDARREILLQRLRECGVGYAEPVEVSAAGEGSALTTRWQAAWTPSVAARLDLVGVRGVTAAQAADGTLRENHRRAAEAGRVTPARVVALLGAAARCALADLLQDGLAEAERVLPDAAGLPELLDALDLSESLRRRHLPGTTERVRARAARLTGLLLEAAVRVLPGLAGSDEPRDAVAVVTLAVRSAEDRLGLRLDGELYALSRTGSPLLQGAAQAARVLLDLDGSDLLGRRLAGWVDTATGPDGRHRLERRLTGVLLAAGPLMESASPALGPLYERVETMSDRDFLDRLYPLRGGFRALTPKGRTRVLAAVSDRLGDRPGLRLRALAELVGRWAAADGEGYALLRDLGLAGLVGASAPAPTGAAPAAAPPTERPAPGPVPGAGAPRIGPADRWRLLLGRDTAQLPAALWPYARALDELFEREGEAAGRGRGETGEDGDGGGGGEPEPGAGGPTGGSDAADDRSGGRGRGYPSVRHWAEDLRALFGADIREEVLGRAVAEGRTDAVDLLDAATARPSVELLSTVLSLARGMPEQRLAGLRPLVERLVEELTRELATRLRPTLTGLTSPLPTRRPGGPLDLPRTLRANLAHIRRREDGRAEVVPERPVFKTRTARRNDWRLILVVDVSASMEDSVVWSALTAAVLGGAPVLSTHFLAFSTQVADLTGLVTDPLSLLLEVKVGGGTHIAAGLAHARSLVKVPDRTLVVVVSDFEEGAAVEGLLAEAEAGALVSSGVRLLGCAALDGGGVPRYSVPVARRLAAAGMPVAALSPLSLARWVGEQVRGASR
ncbi:VWA domain-containing protein OS=Streptomyces tendae OX=1932 GN=GUR47_02285 PE=4 SV=1 [Streptomyces tendae]